MKRVWLSAAVPDRLTCNAFAPSGTVTKCRLTRLRSTLPLTVLENVGATRSSDVMTESITTWSTTLVAGSSTWRIAECRPGVRGVALTLIVEVRPLRRLTDVVAENVPSLPRIRTRGGAADDSPDVRFTFTA